MIAQIPATGTAVPVGWKGIDRDTLMSAGVEVDDNGIVSIPYRSVDGDFVFFKKIAANGHRWYAPPPTELGGLIPFGLECLPGTVKRRDILLITEGESCSLCARQHFGSIDGRSVYVLGLPGSSTWNRDWCRYVYPFRAVYVIGDGDKAGRLMAVDVWTDVRYARVVSMPDGDDLRALVQRDGPHALLALMDAASGDLKLRIAFKRPTLEEAIDVLKGEML